MNKSLQPRSSLQLFEKECSNFPQIPSIFLDIVLVLVLLLAWVDLLLTVLMNPLQFGTKDQLHDFLQFSLKHN